MKNVQYFFMLLTALLLTVSCQEERKASQLVEGSKVDSLQQVIDRKDGEINSMMETINQIQDGFRVITEAEDRVSIAKDGEGTNKTQQIREQMEFIASTMKQNRELVSKLRQQLRESSFKGGELKKTIDKLVAQLDEKEQQIKQLRTELEKKDIYIAELDEEVSKLNTRVTSLADDNKQKSETISSQDAQLNTAWFVFGTKRELREQRIIEGDKVLRSNFNKNYFTKIDIRVEKEIKLYSKSARLLTAHPSSSYSLVQDSSKQYVLKINNPQLFWSTSKFLVVLVK